MVSSQTVESGVHVIGAAAHSNRESTSMRVTAKTAVTAITLHTALRVLSAILTILTRVCSGVCVRGARAQEKCTMGARSQYRHTCSYFVVK